MSANIRDADAKHRTLATRVLGRGLLTAESLASDIRERIVRELASNDWRSPWERMLRLRAILEEHEEAIAEAVANVDLAAWLAGVDSVRKKLPDWALSAFSMRRFDPPAPPFRGLSMPGDGEPLLRFPLIERAAEDLFSRRVVDRFTFDRLADEARQRAFTVAGDMTTNAIDRVRDVLTEAVQQGHTLDKFREDLGVSLEASFLGPGHVETVFRTNVQSAYSAGHEALAANPIVAELFPYQAYLPIHDGRVREEHLEMGTSGLDGTNVYRRDDPIWNEWTPPAGWNCRCGVLLLSIEAAARAGVKEAHRWHATGQRPLSPEWRVGHVPRNPDGATFGRRRRGLAA